MLAVIGLCRRVSRKCFKPSMAFGFIPLLNLEPNKYLEDQSKTDLISSPQLRGLHRTRNMTSQAVVDSVPQVDIDSDGRFKYILLKLWAANHKDEEDFKYLVRGYTRADWHSEYCSRLVDDLTAEKVTECIHQLGHILLWESLLNIWHEILSACIRHNPLRLVDLLIRKLSFHFIYSAFRNFFVCTVRTYAETQRIIPFHKAE